MPDAVVDQFFAPGPDPAGLAVAGDTLWVADEEQRLLYQMDRTGSLLASFPITPTGRIRGLAWDGEALRLVLSSQMARLDTNGKVLASFSIPVNLIDGMGWNPADATWWTFKDEFLLQFTEAGELLQYHHTPVFGSAEELIVAPDGLWVVNTFVDWYRLSFAGEQLRKGDLPAGDFPYRGALAWDERGYLWLATNRQIYQISVRQEKVQLMPTPKPGEGGELVLPRPQLEPVPGQDGAIVHVTNDLGGTMSLSFGSESAILAPGQTWSAELIPGVYEVFASANVPKPVAFSSKKELLLGGYEYTWSLARPTEQSD